MWVGLTQLIQGLSRTKRLPLPQIRVNSPCMPSDCDISFLLPLTQTEVLALPGSKHVAFTLEPHHGLTGLLLLADLSIFIIT